MQIRNLPLMASVLFLALINGLAPAGAAEVIPRVGILFIGGRDQPHLESFKQGLRERGYMEGKNIILVYRYAEGQEERLADLAADLRTLRQAAPEARSRQAAPKTKI